MIIIHKIAEMFSALHLSLIQPRYAVRVTQNSFREIIGRLESTLERRNSEEIDVRDQVRSLISLFESSLDQRATREEETVLKLQEFLRRYETDHLRRSEQDSVTHNGVLGLIRSFESSWAIESQVLVKNQESEGMVLRGRLMVEAMAVYGDHARRCAASVFGALAVGDYEQVSWIANYYGLEVDAKRALYKNVNMRFLYPQELELTGHGIMRSFRFWRRDEIVDYLTEANEIISLLKRTLTSDISFGFGTSLGYVRDGTLIPHDDDVDVVVALPASKYKSIVQGLDAVSEILSSVGREARTWENFLVKTPLACGREIDIFVGIIEDEFVSWFPGPRRQILYSDIYPAKEVSFYDMICPMPANSDAYFGKIYGPDWRVPNAAFRHSWEDTDMNDLREIAG